MCGAMVNSGSHMEIGVTTHRCVSTVRLPLMLGTGTTPLNLFEFRFRLTIFVSEERTVTGPSMSFDPKLRCLCNGRCQSTEKLVIAENVREVSHRREECWNCPLERIEFKRD